MDEQTTLQTQDQQINSEEPQQDFSQDVQQENINPEISINEDGELDFSEDFLADVEKSFFGDRPANSHEEETKPQELAQQNYYTDDELLNTPFEQWQPDRLNGDIKKFVPIVQQQMQKRQMQNQVAQNSQQIPEFLKNQPQQYTPKELNNEAHKLACERLGLNDPDEFDEYEDEHRAALNLAMQELAGNRQREIAEYSRRSADWQQLQNFNRNLAALPDFQEFDQWYLNLLQEKNLTPEQVGNALFQKAVDNNYNFGVVIQEVAGLYKEFQRTKISQTQAQKSRVKKPPVLESTRGGNSDGGRSINLRSFGEMDNDEQIQALMDMGYV